MRWPWSSRKPRLNRRNYPPEHGIRVPGEEIQALLGAFFGKVGIPAGDAELLSRILTDTTRRCLYSHGIESVPHYLQGIKDGRVNPRPELSVVSESEGSLVLDGDGGLGYFPCWRGTLRIIEKAKLTGVAALTTRNHHHFGAAGTYTRLAIGHDCIGWSFSSARLHLLPGAMVHDIIDPSPISIAIPADREPPLVADLGGRLISFEEDLFARLPSTYFKTMALSSAIQALGGVLAGIYREELVHSRWEATQGALIVVMDVQHFMPVDELKREMDRFIARARRTRPLPGMTRAELAGGNEWHWERENGERGIPLSDGHCQALQAEADALGIETPFRRFESTRF